MRDAWSRPARAVATLGVLALATALFAFAWDRGPDVIVDYGRELYVPWRLRLGEVLHRDLAWFNGPLGPWVIEAWMERFGISLESTQWLDASVTIVTLGLLASLMRRFTDDLTTFTCMVVFLTMFAVTQQEPLGSCLFLAPYSHGITFGFAAGVASMFTLVRSFESQRRVSLIATAAVSGGCFGLAFLTKAEVFLAVAVGTITTWVTLAYVAKRVVAVRIGAFLLGAAVPIVYAWARFHIELGGEGVLRALLGTWPYVLDGEVRSMPLYQRMNGTDDLGVSLGRIAWRMAGTAALVALVFTASTMAARRARSHRQAVLLASVIGAVLTWAAMFRTELKWLLLPIPIVVATLGVMSLRALLQERSTRAAIRLSLVAFAAALLVKIAFAPVARDYGFVLAVPATLLFVALLVRWLPESVRASGLVDERGQVVLRAAAAAMVLTACWPHVRMTYHRFAVKTTVIGNRGDRLLVGGERGTVIEALRRDLDARLAREATLLVLPEGIGLNYWLRRETPTRVVNFMPPELHFFDEARILAELVEDPPDAVVLVHRPTDVYGYPFFGQGYGESILGWVREHYSRERLIGGDPFEDGAFGAEILMPNGG